ncbi:hypothetical protein H310_10074 [Aphanomyces invadans]|uniref:Intraflagellar transport protein 43 n=1 Tax=Aphanomyces invadans TaxID=157072 RepID=A0A024TT05_9STRA|nr:hypothetical protein H310_10074 [Aphanomyces invadans]ETV96766.1 hypothetical protein H310_10074 [Aphanomyces invadans]|eukprot:XP_008874543.1 hypothetical protein H310_10074 [Aphanomyces invadans]
MSDADSKTTPRSSRGSVKGAKEDKDDMELDMQDMNSDDKGAPPKRMSGWGDITHPETTKSTVSAADGGGEGTETKRGRRRKEEKAEAAKPKNKHFDDDGEATELMEIPDLEEEEREPDITTQIADAPRNTTRVVQSLKELERDVKYSLPTTAGVDLTILTSFLCPQKAVQEDDDAWDFDSLLRDVFQDVQKEQEEKDNQEEADVNTPFASSGKASVAP